jgi:predicted transcriptional regulator
MAIQPRFSQAILAGEKKVEFRKRRLASDITTVLIYESAPTQRIVGRFTIADTVEGRPAELWRRFGAVGGIPRREFLEYYSGNTRAVGFVVGDVQRYHRPVALPALTVCPAVPQSFAYLPAAIVREISNLQPATAASSLPGVLGRVLRVPGRVLAGVGSR